MPDELCNDTTIDADSKYEVQVHNVILDTIIESISRRFVKNREHRFRPAWSPEFQWLEM